MPVLMFTGTYTLAAAVGALLGGNKEFIFYLVVLLVLIASLYAVHRKHPLTSVLLWCFSLWGLVHMAGGLMPVPRGWVEAESAPVLYNLWLIPGLLKYDQLVHAYGFGITTWLCWHVMRSSLRSSSGGPVRPTAGILVLCIAAGMGFGAFNEVIEFIATLTLPETNVGGYANTGWDLVANLVGSGIAAMAILCGARSQRRC